MVVVCQLITCQCVVVRLAVVVHGSRWIVVQYYMSRNLEIPGGWLREFTDGYALVPWVDVKVDIKADVMTPSSGRQLISGPILFVRRR
jgi:hypothetical protein